jgi:phytoene synthase
MPGDAAKEIEKIVKDAGTSFYWGMRLQPRDKREAIFAVYAFCRKVDDIADSDQAVSVKLKGLETWREKIENLYQGKSDHLITEALLPVKDAYKLEKKAFLDIIDGMEMDARGPIQAPSRIELDLYCARVAGAVGLLCIRIFGESGKKGKELADALGRALQFTNILRDLKEDAEWDRLYLPRDLLEKHGITSTIPGEVLAHAKLDDACRELAKLAAAEFARADAVMAKCNKQDIKPALIMRGAYLGTLERLQKRGWTPEAVAVQPSNLTKTLGKAQKLMVALRHAIG